MPSVYTNFMTGPTAIVGNTPPLTDNITARPIAYASSALRFVVPFTATGGTTYALTASFPSNFICTAIFASLVGALNNPPTGVSLAIGTVAGGAQYVASTTFVGDGIIPLTILPAFGARMAANPGLPDRNFVITPTATTTGSGTSRIYIYAQGIYVDPVDLPINT